MISKSFGSILIIIGIIIIVALFSFSQWNVNLDFIQNLRYAIVYETESNSVIAKSGLRLGQALLIPLTIISIWFLLNKEIIKPELANKLLPFLEK